MSYKKVKEIYWKGNALIIETDDGNIIRYEGAYVKDIKYEDSENSEGWAITQDLPVITKNNESVESWIRKVFNKNET